MTPRIFELPIPGVIVVELPEGGKIDDIFKVKDVMCLSFEVKTNFFDHIKLPPGNWQLIGRLSEVTEEQASGLVYKHEWSDGYRLYKDYEDKLPKDFYHNRISALESLHSAIRAAGLFIGENPYGTEKQHKKAYTGNDMFFIEHMRKWHDAQQRTICPERTVILKRV